MMNDRLTLYIERAAMSEIVKANNGGIQIFAPVENQEDKFAGIPSAGNLLPLFKHNYLGGCFDVPDEPPRIPEFEAMIIHLQEGLRRNFESKFKQGEVIPPTCYSTDGTHGSKPMMVRDFKSVGRKSIYGECKTCFYNQFKTAGAWEDGDSFGAGVQCSNYVLAFLLQVLQHPLSNGQGEILKSGVYRPIILQIPPTSVSVISWNLAHWVGQIPGSNVFNLVWKFIGTGGTKPRSKSNQAINVMPTRGAFVDEVKNVKEMSTQMHEQIQDMALRFASGGDISASTSTEEVEENVRTVGSVEI